MELSTKPLGSPSFASPLDVKLPTGGTCVYCSGTGKVTVTGPDGRREVECPSCDQAHRLRTK